MPEFDETERVLIFTIPENNSSPIKLPKKKGIFQPSEIDQVLRLKWGLALLGEERAKEYLAWLHRKLGK